MHPYASQCDIYMGSKNKYYTRVYYIYQSLMYSVGILAQMWRYGTGVVLDGNSLW